MQVFLILKRVKKRRQTPRGDLKKKGAVGKFLRKCSGGQINQKSGSISRTAVAIAVETP